MNYGEPAFSPSAEGESKRGWGIKYDQLSPEVRPYADNLEAQIWAVFAKYGIVVGEGLAPSHTGGDKPRPYILDELKAKNPTTADLEHLADLLDQLDHIRRTGEPSARTKRELSHLDLEIQLQEAREILGRENVIGPEEVSQVWFPSTLTPPSPLKGEGEKKRGWELPFETPPIPYTSLDLEKAKELGMFLILRISHDQDGNPLTATRMNELIQPRLEVPEDGKLLFDTGWYKDEPYFTQETPVTTPSATQRPSPSEGRGQPPALRADRPGGGEGGLPRAEWKLISKNLLPDSTDKNNLDQTKLLRDTLASNGWLTDEEAAEVTDQKLEALRPMVDSNKETEWKEADRILSQLKLTQHHRRTFC